MNFITALGSQDFLQNALFAGLLASLAAGLVGPYVVVRRIGYLAGGIAHTVLAGMGIAYFIGASPLVGAFISAILAALLIGYISLKGFDQEDTVIGALWAIGMATGILFISQTPGYKVDLMSYLFGNLLLVPADAIGTLAWMVGGLALVLLLVHRPLTAVIFDEEFARLRGVPVKTLYLLLLVMVAITVVLLLQAVGLIMVLALLSLPAALAGHHARSLGMMIVIASLAAMAFTTGGLALSWQFDLPAGATIVLVAGVAYLLSLIWRSARGGLRR
ncbi:metal ABC transporter permease [Cobetia sp. LC6]|uniref:metal ABC transporter permease n=1 Tax=unclassified Cobetia TaxID=2609414 RepID=UPI002556F359|nr:metal ABC transporter permease [Cobetia sp. LC6]MDL2191162.1 metal ABC transporter permease [Cobetia sp. LC6]